MTIIDCIKDDLSKRQLDYELIIKSDITNNEIERFKTAKEGLNTTNTKQVVFGEDIDNVSKKIIYYI